MAKSIEKQVEEAVRKMEEYARALGKEKKPMLEYAAKPVIDIMRSRAPRGLKIHYRYPTRGKGQPKSGRGQGKPIAKYLPGNLKGAVMQLPFRKTSAVFIGPRFAKGGSKGTFGGARFDAYYAHMVEYGTKNMRGRPFVRPAADQGLPIALKRIEMAVKLFTKKYNDRYGIR
jgi:HK97 gp10 family phage protein